jgi:hypothetical protein
MSINHEQITITLTMKELGTTLEGLMGYIAWLENAIEDKARNQEFLLAELESCRAVHPKLDAIWWDELRKAEGDDGL